MSNIAKTIQINDRVVIKIEYDTDSESPANWDNVGQITYNGRGRHCLGTEGISNDRFDEICRQVRDGELIGIPVYAYVHSGSSIKAAWTNPFGCPWDSGQSGWAYCTKERAIAEFGSKIMTKKVREAAIKCLIGEVETFNMYLNGEVYGWIVEVDGEEVDSCWGCYGLEYAESEARAVAAHHIEELTNEQVREPA